MAKKARMKVTKQASTVADVKDPAIAILRDPVVLRQASNVDTIGAAFIARFEKHFIEKGAGIFDVMLEQFPQLYFASLVKLAQIIRIKADVTHKEAKPRTVEEILQRVEQQTGTSGRRAFEHFLTRVQPRTIDHEDK